MDGTLLDSSSTVPTAYAAAIFELSGVRCTPDEVIAQYTAGPASALISAFIGRPATDDDVDCWHRHLEARLWQTTSYPGIEPTMRDLATRGIPLGVFTGATRRAAEMQLEHSGLARFISALVGSDEIGAVKPAPDGLQLVCQRLGARVERTAYVGDARNDLRCARSAGALAVAAAWGHLFELDLEADLILSSPRDLLSMTRSDPS